LNEDLREVKKKGDIPREVKKQGVTGMKKFLKRRENLREKETI